MGQEQRSGMPVVAAVVLIVIAVGLLVWAVMRSRGQAQAKQDALPNEAPAWFGSGQAAPIAPGEAGAGGMGGAPPMVQEGMEAGAGATEGQ